MKKSKKRSLERWSAEHDKTLAETIIDFIGTGKKQADAIRAVAKKINRTEAACVYRWNSVVRKAYQDKLQEANQGIKEITKINNEPTTDQKSTVSSISKMAEEFLIYVKDLEENLQHLQKENETLRKENEGLQSELQEVGQIFSRAHKMLKDTNEQKVS